MNKKLKVQNLWMGSIHNSKEVEKDGIVNYVDLIDGVLIAETVDDANF